jgi:hypothetical protein
LTPSDLIHEFEQLGVSIWCDGDALKFDAPTGTMTPERINLLKKHKPELMAFLRAGSALKIDPLDSLTERQLRAVNVLKHLISVKQQNLISKGYSPDNAMVKRQEWRDLIIRKFDLSFDQMNKLESQLYAANAIGYEVNKLYIVDGDIRLATHSQKDNPNFRSSGSTGLTFCGWSYH